MVAQLGDPGSGALPERIAAAVAWADVVLAGGHVADGDPVLERLQASFTPPEVVELTYAIGTFTGYSKLIVVLGLEWDEAVPVLEIPTPGA